LNTSFWNFLTFTFCIAGVLLAGLFYHVFNNPYSNINPYPPPTPISTALFPTLTASPQALPDLWTSTPEIGSPEVDENPLATTDSQETPTAQPSKTPVIISTEQSGDSTAKAAVLPTAVPDANKQPAAPVVNQPESQESAGSIVLTAPVGVFNNTWQNLQSIPSFSWKVPNIFLDIKNSRVYFSTHLDGNPAATITKSHYSHPAVPSGEYYMRVEAAGTNGAVIDSSPLFVFRYDDTPPTEPVGFGTTDPGTTVTPYFTWMPSIDSHSGMEGGMAGYAIYQGPVSKCGKPVAFTSVPNWTPVTPLVGGVTEYFCVKALDAIGNESNWTGPVSFNYTP